MNIYFTIEILNTILLKLILLKLYIFSIHLIYSYILTDIVFLLYLKFIAITIIFFLDLLSRLDLKKYLNLNNKKRFYLIIY